MLAWHFEIGRPGASRGARPNGGMCELLNKLAPLHGSTWHLTGTHRYRTVLNKKHMKKALLPIAVCFSLLTVLMPVTYLASLLY